MEAMWSAWFGVVPAALCNSLQAAALPPTCSDLLAPLPNVGISLNYFVIKFENGIYDRVTAMAARANNWRARRVGGLLAGP